MIDLNLEKGVLSVIIQGHEYILSNGNFYFKGGIVIDKRTIDYLRSEAVLSLSHIKEELGK